MARPLPLRQLILAWVITLLSVALAAGLVAMPNLSGGSAVTLAVGQSATQDILAPRALNYVSETLTRAAREQAAAAVPEVYDPPDARVARQQVLLLRDILEFVSTIRTDSYAPHTQKLTDLAAIRDLPLSPDTASQILNFTDTQWTAVESEAVSVLEQMMRGQVRANELEEVRRSTLARVSVDLSETQAELVSALVSRLVVPNSFYNEAATQSARDAARSSLPPVYKRYVPGQSVVARGQVVTETEIEALQAFGLLQDEQRWQETLSALLVGALVGLLLVLYVIRLNPELAWSLKHILLLSLLFNAALFGAKLMVPEHALLPYLFPAGALAMLVTVVGGTHLALMVSLAMGVLVGFISGNRLDLALYTVVGALVAALTLGKARRVNLFFWAGLAGAVANIGVVIAFWITGINIDLLGLAQLVGVSLLNGAASASLTLVGFFILGSLFDVTTSLQLIELSRPDHPLLQLILRQAPGTYQHSLQVSNLAEQAAERIGADALLIRVGALYHDVGKALHPQYFIENQITVPDNIHNSLDPYTSASIILGHIVDGVDMARRYRLPSRIRAFITEHHGTLKTMYQYKRALEAAGNDPRQVDESRFRYPGPCPQSKETALLMLADGCEAKTRADRPATEEDLDRIVKAVIDDRLAKAQLDDTTLTVRDLQAIRVSFVNTLKGMYHTRLQYPEEKPAELPPPAPEKPA